MSETGRPPAVLDRRRRELERALVTLRKAQGDRIYGVVSLHFQAGRIVRAEVKTTEKFPGG